MRTKETETEDFKRAIDLLMTERRPICTGTGRTVFPDAETVKPALKMDYANMRGRNEVRR